MMNAHSCLNDCDHVVGVDADQARAQRVRAVRARLPGQLRIERSEAAALAYGPLYTRAEVTAKVAETLPPRLGFRRGVRLEPIESYNSRIPDDALLKYADAEESGLFARFLVATPTYRQEMQVDPWILGELEGERFAVIAHWT